MKPRTGMRAKIVGRIDEIETISKGTVTIYGEGRLKKRKWTAKKGLARLRFDDGRESIGELHWHELNGVRKRVPKIKRFMGVMAGGRRRLRARFLICISSREFLGSLEWSKVYREIPDATARKRGCVRVIDDSGDDYLYSEGRFVAIRLPAAARRALSRSS